MKKRVTRQGIAPNDDPFFCSFGEQEKYCTLSAQKLSKNLNELIVSVSGWRKIFAADRRENSFDARLNPGDKILAAAAAAAFCQFLSEENPGRRLIVYLATDSRPTGPGLAGAMATAFLAAGVTIKYAAVCAAPEIMALTARTRAHGFAYVSASHNPIGYNGFKFGGGQGGVLAAAEAARLERIFRTFLADSQKIATLNEQWRQIKTEDKIQTRDCAAEHKQAALSAYRDFILTVTAGSNKPAIKQNALRFLRQNLQNRPLGVIIDFNGSARIAAGDCQLFDELGVRRRSINAVLGRPEHAIIPEGESLEAARLFLEQTAAEDPSFILGYVPDNDGDRGNLVYRDKKDQKSHVLSAQKLFCLAVVSELAWLAYRPELTDKKPVAVAVNGPTSLMVEEAAGIFGAKTLRAEVGEANVVAAARDAIEKGYFVRILGEGSNGGSIVRPASVRDPINTIMALIKFLTTPSTEGRPGPWEIWWRKSGQSAPCPRNPDLGDLARSLPVYATTGAAEERAVIRLEAAGALDQKRLKIAYEAEFELAWAREGNYWLERLSASGWRQVNYQGASQTIGVGPAYRSGKHSGGLKIEFLGIGDDLPVAFIWWRASGTEPVLRVLADVAGNCPDLEAELLRWQRLLLEKAAARISD